MRIPQLLAPLTAAFLLAAPGIADAQLDDIGAELGKAAAEVGKAAGDVGAELNELEKLGADVDGVEAPKGTKATYGCSKYQRIVVNYKKGENKVLGDKKTKLVIRASGHCKVVLRNVTLRGDSVIDVSGHALVLLNNVTVEGGKLGLEASGHAHVRLRNSKMSAKKKAMRVSGHARVLIENSKLKGSSKVSGYGLVSYDGKSKVGKLRKSGRYSTIRKQ